MKRLLFKKHNMVVCARYGQHTFKPDHFIQDLRDILPGLQKADESIFSLKIVIN